MPVSLPILPAAVLTVSLLRIVSDLGAQLSYQTRDNQLQTSYDFIVVGGTISGSVIASRLAKKYRVLLLETGSGSSPSRWALSGTLSSSYNQPYMVYYGTQVQNFNCKGMYGDQCLFSRSRGLGGSISELGRPYMRGLKEDYDSWNVKGWSYEELLPYFYRGERIRRHFVLKRGPVHESSVPLIRTLPGAFEEAGADLGYPVGSLDGECDTGFMATHRMDLDSGFFDAAGAYLKPALETRNLHVDLFSRINKILINSEKEAYGVEVFKDGVTHSYIATKEVILTAGTIENPKILKLSGVGHGEELKIHAIPTVSDVPVGERMISYPNVLGVTSLFGSALDDVARGIARLANPQRILEPFTRQNPVNEHMFDAIAMINTKKDNSSDCRADVSIPFATREFTSRMPFSIKPEVNAVVRPLFGRVLGIFDPLLLYPNSRGLVLLKSANPQDQPLVVHNMLSNEDDVVSLREAIKFVIGLTKTPTWKSVSGSFFFPNLPGCAHLPPWGDEYIDCFVRHLAISVYDVGTTRMGDDDDDNRVVDSKLRVLGVKGLRAAGVSVIPKATRGTEEAEELMVGEKASDLILEDWEGEKKKGYPGYYHGWPCRGPCPVAALRTESAAVAPVIESAPVASPIEAIAEGVETAAETVADVVDTVADGPVADVVEAAAESVAEVADAVA